MLLQHVRLVDAEGERTGDLLLEEGRIAAVATFATTASGISVLGLGAPVWGLAAGCAILALDAGNARIRRRLPR